MTSEEFIWHLRTFVGDKPVVRAAREAADLIEQQAARIAELEARSASAVAWQVRRSDGRIDGVPILWESCTKDLYEATLATGRYAGYEGGPRCEVRALYAAPVADSAMAKDAALTDQEILDVFSKFTIYLDTPWQKVQVARALIAATAEKGDKA